MNRNLLTKPGQSVAFTVVDETPPCDRRRPYTNARCERPPGHDDDFHAGRDTAGRWHVWEPTP